MKTKSQTDIILNRTLVLTLLLILFAGSLGFFTVWLRHQISIAANANKNLELKVADLNRRIDEVNAQVAVAVNPDNLLALNDRMGLHLVRPREPQVVRIPDDVEVRLAVKRNEALFSSDSKFQPREFNLR